MNGKRQGSTPALSRARCAYAVGDPDAMTDMPNTEATNGVPTYLGRGDPTGRFADYYPAWMDKLAGDVTGPPTASTFSPARRERP